MTSAFIDVSQGVGSEIDCLKKQGIKAVGRYYNYGTGSKILTRQEAAALIDANISIWVVFEFWNNAPKWFNADLGRQDATRALQSAQEIVGQPEGTTIYFAADYDETGTNYPTRIVPYFRSIRSVFQRPDGTSPYRIGVYSNGLVCRRLLADGLVDDTWLSCSTGYTEHKKFYDSKQWSIAQTCGTPQVCSLDTDDDEVGSSDFGQFSTLSPLKVSHISALLTEFHDQFVANANDADAASTVGAVGLPVGEIRKIEVADLLTTSASTDKQCVPRLIQLGEDVESLHKVQDIAARSMKAAGYGYTLHNACAATLSAFLNEAGISVVTTLGAGRLAKRLSDERNWERVSVGNQQAGDVGVALNDVHIFLVVAAKGPDEMTIADNQAPTPHTRFASGKGKTQTANFLRAPDKQPKLMALRVTAQIDQTDQEFYPGEDESTNQLNEINMNQETITNLLPLSDDHMTKLADQIAKRISEKTKRV